jgi:hypothetical protein
MGEDGSSPYDTKSSGSWTLRYSRTESAGGGNATPHFPKCIAAQRRSRRFGECLPVTPRSYRFLAPSTGAYNRDVVSMRLLASFATY